MNYYKDHYALQMLRCKQGKYTSEKQLALSEIYRQLHDGKTALSLLQSFMHRYKNDNTIYLSVNDIASRLKAFDVLAESAKKALAYAQLNAQAHYDFGTLFKRHNSSGLLVDYLHCINESHLRIPFLPWQIDNALSLIQTHFRSEAEKRGYPHDYIRLGNFLVFARQLKEALIAYSKATGAQRDYAVSYRNLSFVFKLLECPLESEVALAHSYFASHRHAAAIRSYLHAQSLGDSSAEIYEKLAQSYLHEGRFYEAAETCADGIGTHETATLYAMWIAALQSINQIDRALEVAERAYAAFPQEQYFQFAARLILPVIYKSGEDITSHRIRFCRTLRAWSNRCEKNANYVAKYAVRDIKGTNFYLPYQGQCDLDIHKEYGHLLHRIMAATYPQFSDRPPYKPRVNKRHIRIGYISAYCNWHTVSKLFLGWVQHHNSEMFEVYVYHLGRKMDFVSNVFKAGSGRFVHCTDHDVVRICECIRADNLDILVYLEIGMKPLITKIAALRLARIQCVAWGHPVTSGLPTIDYFISSEMMEPPDGDNHYSETLVKLPNIGVCVPKPMNSTSNKTRTDYGLSDKRTVYVFPHSLFKHLPQYDGVFPSIAKSNPNSQFVFIENEAVSAEAAHDFKIRLADAFRQHALEPNEYIHFVPHQGLQEFIGLLTLSDVYLDCIGWSGGMTTLEALGCMLPIVTMPGQFMRGRHAYGCLKRIGVGETVAEGIEDYVNVAVRLGLDKAWRKAVISKQAANLDSLYDDRDCIVELEKFYQAVVTREKP
jgi:protein O-GlcNAc transferase